MKTVILRVALGISAGILAWMITEPFAPGTVGGEAWAVWERYFMLALGGLVGGTLGGLTGFTQGSRTHFLRGLGFGVLFGVIGIMLGYQIGGGLASAMAGGKNISEMGPTAMILRIVALTPIGAALGLALGATTFERTRIIQGLIGGAIGGFVGSVLFDPIGAIVGLTALAIKGQTHGEIGGLSRLIYNVLLAGGIALFIALIERSGQKAFIRKVLGRNEGKEWPVDLPVTILGRSELAQIPLFGDSQVAERHAIIRRHGEQYFLEPFAPTLVNGQPTPGMPLFHGAQITMGQTTLIFLMKSQQVPVHMPMHQTYHPEPMQYAHPVQTMQPPQSPLQPTIAMPAPQMAAALSLVAIEGPLSGQRFPLNGPLELGRESVIFPLAFDQGVSRRHVSLSPAQGGIAVTDLGSTNGTFVNGHRVQQAILNPGELLRVGMSTFRLEH